MFKSASTTGRVASDRAGSVAVIAGFVMPVLVFISLLAFDFANAVAVNDGLQRAADAGALGGARQMIVASTSSRSAALATAQSVALDAAQSLNVENGSVSVTASADRETRGIALKIDASPRSILAGLILGRPLHASVSASALPIGDKSMCVLTLRTAGVVLRGSSESAITANGCIVHANSKSAQGLTLVNSSAISAEQICTAGGYRGAARATTPEPVTDCPQITDPLLDREAPKAGPCTYTDRAINHISQKWSPGVYCNGMYLNNGAKVTLEPGVYILKGGLLTMKGGASLTGVGVTLVFTGGARMNIAGSSLIDLSAPATGPTAGLLVFGDRDSPPTDRHEFNSNNARNLLGTIYLPNATLKIAGSGPVADRSPWTAIVAGALEIDGRAQVTLNSRYDDTDVPLPKGLDSPGRDIRLMQ